MVESSLQSAKAKSSGIFVPSKNGFRELTDNLSDTSIIGIAKHMGYHENQIHASYGSSNEVEPEITAIAWEIFSTNIIFVLTGSSVLHLSEDKVNNFMEDFDYNFEYESIMIEETLLAGIENRSLKIGFLCRIFGIDSNLWNDYMYFGKIGVHAFFINGYLAAFKFEDEELGEWARYVKRANPDAFTDYTKVAKQYWKEDYGKITFEVNAQFEAWANTPDATKNKHVPLHTTRFNTINFVMLLVCHYGKHIDIEEFKTINHGRYKKISESDVLVTYECGNFIYEFDEEGFLANKPKLKNSVSASTNWSKN